MAFNSNTEELTEEQKTWVKRQMRNVEVVRINNKKDNNKKEEIAYKYSNRGKGLLRESVLIEGIPYFIKYSFNEKTGKDYILCEPKIEEHTRVIRPPYEEECPHIPYDFKDESEPNYYLQSAKDETLDSIYQKIKSIVKKYNDIDEKTVSLLSADILGSYFQDRFSTVHYLFVVGDNGTGKSVFGDTFECLGYRPVNITNATEAFWFRIFGTNEPGQVTIIAEEIDKLDENSQIMAMLKVGYQPNAKVPRMNNDNDKMDFYYPFCFKIMIAERSPSEDKARGVLDRSFKLKSYKGYPDEKIKDIRNPQGNANRKKLLDEINDLRKLLLMYRLIHFNDPFEEVDIGLDGRDEELCKPILQLFYTLGASDQTQKEIETTLQHFLNIKNNRKENSLEALIYPVIVNCVSQIGKEISSNGMWDLVTSTLDGEPDERDPHLYYSADYGRLYRSTTIKMICDKFGVEKKHERTGNVLIFDIDFLSKMGNVYGKTNGIQTKLLVDDGERGTNKRDSCDSCDALTDNGHMINKSDTGKMEDNQAQNSVENDNLMKEFDDNEPKKNYPLSQNESHGSHESPVDIKEQAKTKVKCPTCDYFEEPYWMKIHDCPYQPKNMIQEKHKINRKYACLDIFICKECGLIGASSYMKLHPCNRRREN